jgi:hypothetical protein
LPYSAWCSASPSDDGALRQAFGTATLGAITGLIVMVHHTCGGFGARIGAALFDGSAPTMALSSWRQHPSGWSANHRLARK